MTVTQAAAPSPSTSMGAPLGGGAQVRRVRAQPDPERLERAPAHPAAGHVVGAVRPRCSSTSLSSGCSATSGKPGKRTSSIDSMSTPTRAVRDGDLRPSRRSARAGRERLIRRAPGDRGGAARRARAVETQGGRWARPRSRRHVVRARAQRHTPWPLTAGRGPAWRARGRRGGHGRQGRRRRAAPRRQPRQRVQVGRGESCGRRCGVGHGLIVTYTVMRAGMTRGPRTGRAGVLRQRLPVRPLTAA